MTKEEKEAAFQIIAVDCPFRFIKRCCVHNKDCTMRVCAFIYWSEL